MKFLLILENKITMGASFGKKRISRDFKTNTHKDLLKKDISDFSSDAYE